MEDVPFTLLTSSAPESEYQPSSPRRPNRKLGRFLLIPLFIVIVGMLLLAGSMFKGSKTEETPSDITPAPTFVEEEVFPTDPPVPTEVPTSTPAPKPTVNPIDKATGLDRSTLSVAVKNGSGTAGAGSKASDTLKSFGYNVISVGNADSFEYQNVSIEVKASKSQFLNLLKKDLGLSYTIGSTSASLSDSVSSDAVVTVGK